MPFFVSNTITYLLTDSFRLRVFCYFFFGLMWWRFGLVLIRLTEKRLKSVCTVTSFRTYCGINHCTVCHLLQKLFNVHIGIPVHFSVCVYIVNIQICIVGWSVTAAADGVSFIHSQSYVYNIHIECTYHIQWMASMCCGE